MNVEQLTVVKKIINAIKKQNKFSKNGAIFFLNSPNVTWKTKLQNIVKSKLRSQQPLVLAVAEFDITTTLPKGKRIVYSQFKILLDAETNSRYRITKVSNRVNLFQRTELIIWDKTPIQSKYSFETVNYVF